MKNIEINQGFEPIDIASLDNVIGGVDPASQWYSKLKENLGHTYNRYSSAAKGYYSGGKKLVQGNVVGAAKDVGGAVVDHAAGGLNLMQTVKDATDIIPRP